MRINRRRCSEEERGAANPGDKHDGDDGYDPLDHDRSSMAQTSSAANRFCGR
jgi:hypothetical protein